MRERRLGRRFVFALSLTSIALGLAIGGNILWFYLRLSVEGSALVSQEKASIEAATKHASLACSAPWPTSSGPQGLLEAPSIGLQAPVLEGTDDAQLDVAVGHLPDSAWPGQPGTSLLAAHDVSYFSLINTLEMGAIVDFITPCQTFVYRVTDSQVVETGSPVYSDPGVSELVLETCYPLNALFLSSQRYLVTADLTAIVASDQPIGDQTAQAPPAPVVAAVPALAEQGLGLSTNNIQLGTQQLQGAPDPGWQQSVQPIEDEEAVIASYNAAIRSAEQGQESWWQPLTNGVPFSSSAPLQGGQIVEYTEALTPTLIVQGTSFTGAVVDAGIKIAGGASPGSYHLHATMIDSVNTLIITSWQLVPGS
jgi:sortase A